MALPYTMPPVSPFDVITSQAENEKIANIEALAAGTGLDDGAVTTAKIDDGAVTASKLDFETYIELGRATAASNVSSLNVTISPKKFLKIVAYGRTTGDSNTGFTFNGLTGVYHIGAVYGTLVSTALTRTLTGSNVGAWVAGDARDFSIEITMQGKPVRGTVRGSLYACSYNEYRSGGFSFTTGSNITSITLTLSTGTLVTGTEFVVYGHN